MNKYVGILLLLYSLITHAAQNKDMTLKDPFQMPPLIPCADIETQLRNQINQWQFQGYVEQKMGSQHIIAIIHKVNNKIWLTLSDLTVPMQLLPWKIITITRTEIHWQANLPDYCQKNLILTMKLQGV